MQDKPTRKLHPPPPPEIVAAAARAVAETLMEKYPALEVSPHEPGRRLPPGARVIPAATRPPDREPLIDWPDERGGRGSA